MRVGLLALFVASVIPASAQTTGKILFYREPHYLTNDFNPRLLCDGVEIARIESGTYFQVTASVGRHSCTVEPSKRSAIEVSVSDGQTAYVHLGLESTVRNLAYLANTTDGEYARAMPKLKPLKEWDRDTLSADSAEPISSAERDGRLRVVVTDRKSWLASGGFSGAREAKSSQFERDFEKGCPNVRVTDMQNTADFAVTLDEISTAAVLLTPDQPTFTVAVYSRTGLLYSGGTSFLKNAVKDACNAIGAR